MNRGPRQTWTSGGSCGDGGNWKPQQGPFSHPPPFSVPPPRPCGSSAWSSGPPPPFSVPPPPFSGQPGPPPSFPGPPPSFSTPPPQFSGPPSQFSGPPPSFGGSSSGNTALPSWSSPHSSAGPWPDSREGQCRDKRPVNKVWSDPSLLTPSQKPFHRQQNGNGYPQHGHGQQGGPGGRGRGHGRGKQSFQQERNSQSTGNCLWNNNGINNNNSHNNNDNSQRHNNNQKHCGKKKEKVDKRDLPENNQYHCEVCDRGFKTEEKYKEHVSQHTQCWVTGCRYVAAPKLVELHYNSQHRTGVAKKIWSLDSPEAIRKWIEDRKRNYPTKENIARKEKERAERRARGEVIENKQFGKMRGRGRGYRGRHQRGRGRYGFGGRHWEEPNEQTPQRFEEKVSQLVVDTEDGHQTQELPCTPSKISGQEDDSPEETSLEPKAKKRKLDKDDEGERTKEEDDSMDPLLVEGDGGDGDVSDDAGSIQMLGDGLTSLMASYDDSAKEDGEFPEDEEESGNVVKPNSSQDVEVKDSWEMNKHPDDIVAPMSPVTREEPAWIRHNKRRRDQKYRNNMLLERLLVNEIRHERNVLLQCVHYIVKNNFLGVGDQTAGTAGK